MKQCQKYFLFNRVYDPVEDVVLYVCKETKAQIKMCFDDCEEAAKKLDSKVYESIIRHCQNCCHK